MKLLVPYIGELRDLDARMVRLAEFLGISCETLSLESVTDHTGFLEKAVPDACSCLVVNSQLMEEWVGSDELSGDLVAFLLSRFPHLLVHGLRASAFDSALVTALSKGKLSSVGAIERRDSVYVIAEDAKDISEAFSGLSFGPVNAVNDHVFGINGSDPTVQRLISINGRPFMAAVRVDGSELLFIASEDVVDLGTEVGESPLAEYFSRVLPHAMALRHVAGCECWRPYKAHAAIIVDDPLLRRRYGFLNFEALLHLAKAHNFHAAIAFIPHNFRRNSSRITRMFCENPARLSICFHGNDHLESEFASANMALLNTLLRVAETRIDIHQQMTGLPCDRVMVFPQGKFSIEAMKVLKSHNFHAAVNTDPHPWGQPVKLRICELAQPAVFRYGNFPLFLRQSIQKTKTHDIAFNVFFGRPVLIGEHHEVFQRPEALAEFASRINSLVPGVQWSNLATAVGNSILTKKAPDGTYHVRAYAGSVQILNDSNSVRRYSIDWGGSCEDTSIDHVLLDSTPFTGFEIRNGGLHFSVQVDPGSSQTFSLVHRNLHATVRNLGPRWNVQAFLRRRLSEVRDNYLCKNQHLLTAAKAFQRRFLKI